MFLKNEKLVCIDDKFSPKLFPFYKAFPVKGVIYTCRGLCPAIDMNMEPEIGVYLEEIINPCSNIPPHAERSYRAERFAPLETLTEEEILALGKNKEKEKEKEKELIKT